MKGQWRLIREDMTFEWLFTSHLINVSLDPVARWTIKVSYSDVSFAQNKCEGSSEAEGYDRNSRQQNGAWCPCAEGPLKLFTHF